MYSNGARLKVQIKSCQAVLDAQTMVLMVTRMKSFNAKQMKWPIEATLNAYGLWLLRKLMAQLWQIKGVALQNVKD